MLAGHGAARAGAGAALRRFAEELGVAVATTFNGKGVFPDDHPQALGAVGFMRHDYVNFGFDEADVIVAVGYELQEFDPVRINPLGDKKIIHIHRFPAEVDVHYQVEVGLQSDIPRTLEALADAVGRCFNCDASGSRIRAMLAEELTRGGADDSYPLTPARIVADTRAALGRERHRARRHRRSEDVDGAALPDVRAEHVPDLKRAIDDGVDRARRDRGEDRPPRLPRARRDRRRRLHDELAGDRDRAT